ncbi:MAG: SDR family oxidoreductase [Thermoflavifilum aggregans]|nr:SDR family oxidoreductase [Thermoflavifilum aggregans]
MPTALILGATSDIAQAIARELAAKQYDLILAARNMNYIERIQKDIQIRYGVQVKPKYFDATTYEQHDDFLKQTEVFPEVVVVCFGYLGEQKKAEANWDEAYQILATNYIGAVSILNLVAQEMEKRKQGIIIGISSVAGDRGRKSNYIYGSAKAGFTTYLSGLRNRLYTSGVHVLTVKPGYVTTRMTENMNLPKLLTTTPEKVAKSISKAIRKKKNTIYVKKIWWLVMIIIRCLPESIFKKLNL